MAVPTIGITRVGSREGGYLRFTESVRELRFE